LDLNIFVGNVTIREGLGVLGDVIEPWAPKSRGNFLFLFQKRLGETPHLETPLMSLLSFAVSKLWRKVDN